MNKFIKKNFGLLGTINMADTITLTGLIPVIFAFYFALLDKPFHSIIAICLAFIFDILDGYVARKYNVSSDLGRQLDSFLDAFNYLGLSSIFLYKFLNVNNHITLITIFILLLTGILRLSRHNLLGFSKNKNNFYYTGLIVPYAQLAIIVIFFITIYLSENIKYIIFPILLIISFLMISDFKIKKTKNYFFIFLLIILFIFLSLINI
jgi:phosphatidylserine synthase